MLCVVLVIDDMLAPSRALTSAADLKHGEMGHEAIRSGTVPVLFAWLEKDAIPRINHLDLPAAALRAADPLADMDSLAMRVGIPRRSGARREVNAARAQTRCTSAPDWIVSIRTP